MALTGRAALVAALGTLVVGLVFPHGWGLLAVQGVLLAGILVDLWLAAPVGALRMERAGDTSVRLGETATVTLVVGNPGPRPLRGLIRDAWRPSAGAAPARHAVRIAPGATLRLRQVLEPTRRGDQPAVRVTVRSVGPLGLAARQGGREVPWTVRTLPPFLSRRYLPSRLARLRELDGREAVRVRGQGTEFDSLREYVAGDDVRSIDWRATARSAAVVVRTWRPERDQRILLVLDTGRTSASRVRDVPRLDVSLDAALLLGALASRAGDRVDLLAFDRVPRARVAGTGMTGAAQLLPAMVDALAPVQPALVETDMRALVTAVLSRSRRRSLVVLFTALEAAAVEEVLLPELPALTRAHHVLIASVADPAVAEMAAGRGDATAVYGAAAAERAGAERRQTRWLLERRGVLVVDAGPDTLAPAVADAYLGLKASGRL